MGLHTYPQADTLVTTDSAQQSVKSYKQYYTDYLDSNLEGFIYHPHGFPITWRPVQSKKYANPETECHRQTHIGLCFESEKYIKPGIILELTMQVRGEDQKFTGQVILVRSKEKNFEIGIWIASRSDASRLRIVEQICHIEAYMKHKRHCEGPFFSTERVTREWITRFASSFPSLG